MKKIIALLVAVTASISMAVSSFAATPSVYLNGEKMTFDVDPFIEEDRTLVPLRAIFEACGASLIWDQDTLTALATKDTTDEEGNTVASSVVVQINNPVAFVDGNPVELDVPAKVVNDRTFVPIRFVVESLGEKVEWNQDELRVDITLESVVTIEAKPDTDNTVVIENETETVTVEGETEADTTEAE